MTDKPLSRGQKVVVVAGAVLSSRRVRLFIASVLFVGWLSYLGFAALTKSREPVISRAQAAAAKHALVATIQEEGGKPRSTVKVLESLWGEGPAAGTETVIENLPSATTKGGYTGSGDYLLLLTDPPFRVVGQQRSPGNDLAHVGPPLIYRWSEGLRREFQALPPPLDHSP
jgi:hypothetical protein